MSDQRNNFTHVIEHPVPYQDFKRKDSSFSAIYVQTTITTLIAIHSCYKFIIYFFNSFHNKSQSPKAMYFWILGTFLNCFITIYSFCQKFLNQTYLGSTYRVFLSILDMWPFMVVILLALDVLKQTGVFSNFEKRFITNMVYMNFIYSICLPTFTIIFTKELKDLSNLAFLNVSYIPLAIFMVFLSYVFIRIFVCEHNTPALLFGAGPLRKFQTGTFFLILFLFGKILFIYINNVPPYYIIDYAFYNYKTGTPKQAKYIFEFMFNIVIYIVPYLLIAAGAGYTKKKEEFASNENAPENKENSVKKTTLDDSLLQDS